MKRSGLWITAVALEGHEMSCSCSSAADGVRHVRAWMRENGLTVAKVATTRGLTGPAITFWTETARPERGAR
mgnify:FL=1